MISCSIRNNFFGRLICSKKLISPTTVKQSFKTHRCNSLAGQSTFYVTQFLKLINIFLK